MSKNKEKKEPLFHVTKRASIPFWQSAMIRVIALALAMIVCMLLSLIVLGINPAKMLVSMFSGCFATSRRIWKFVKDLSILLLIALAITPAFKMKFWNIGAEGQALMGALASVALVVNLGGKVPEALLVVLMLIASLVVSAIWGVLPAVCNAIWGTNETLFTLMMNYIASFIVAYFLLLWTPSGSSTLGRLNYGYLPVVGHEYLLIIVITLLVTIGIFIYMKYTKHGYELTVVGESQNTARYIGIDVKKVIIRTMALSGAMCGLAGFLLVAGLDHSITTASIGGRGFTAIMVSWLAKFNPFVMIGTSGLITFLNQGAAQMSTDFNIDSSFPNLIVGIIIFFIIGCEFFMYYKVTFRRKGDKK